MPKGPSGQKRPADVTQNAVMVMRIATGQEKEVAPAPRTAAEESGSKGGKARARKLSESERKKIAAKAAESRWKKGRSVRAVKERS